MKSLIVQKKGQVLGLDTVKGVIIAFLVISVIAITIILAGTNMTTVYESIDTQTGTLTNVTTSSVVNDSAIATPTGVNSVTFKNCALTITGATNASSPNFINSANYTVVGCTISNTGGNDYNGTLWNISGSYSYVTRNAEQITRNISGGLTDFFTNTSTIFSILIVVVIILAISIIILAVQRFTGNKSGL